MYHSKPNLLKEVFSEVSEVGSEDIRIKMLVKIRKIYCQVHCKGKEIRVLVNVP